MSFVSLNHAVGKVTDPITVECTSRPLSEHIWLYFEFGYDPNFKTPEVWKPEFVNGVFNPNSFPGSRDDKRYLVIGAPGLFTVTNPNGTFTNITNGNVVIFDSYGDLVNVNTFDTSGLVVPTQGQYDVFYSENGINWATWQALHDVDSEDYSRLYKVAGYITHVKVVPTIAVQAAALVAPHNLDPLYAKIIIARV